MASLALFNFVENSTADNASRAAAEAENGTRAASVECTYTSTGYGQHRIWTPIIFPVIFSSEPHFTSGSGTIKSAGKGYYDPIGTAGVFRWEVDGRGRYLGANIWVRVDIYPVEPPPVATSHAAALKAQQSNLRLLAAMKTLHYLTFTGRAIKDIPSKGATMIPHPVGL